MTHRSSMSSPRWPLPRWIAHRGAGRWAPENTLAAFREGARYGYRAFECDVKLSADGVAFLLHDATLDRTASGDFPAGTCAGDLDWSALSRLDAGSWLDPRFAGEPPASLAAVARYCLANRHALNIEIKPTPGVETVTGARVAEQVRALWAPAVTSGQADWPLVSSFAPGALAAARDAAPELPRALLLDRLAPDSLATAQALNGVAVILNHRLVEPSLVEHCHALGLALGVYTVNDADVAARLLGWGVDAIITDAVDQLSPQA